MTTVLVFRSTERISSVAETWPLRMANRKSLAARAEAPSRTPSLSNAETFAVTSRLNVFAARPDPCPSAKMTDIPPPGRSTISTVSPLSRDAYLLVLATATSIFRGMTAPPSLVPPATGFIHGEFQGKVVSLSISLTPSTNTSTSRGPTVDQGDAPVDGPETEYDRIGSWPRPRARDSWSVRIPSQRPDAARQRDWHRFAAPQDLCRGPRDGSDPRAPTSLAPRERLARTD